MTNLLADIELKNVDEGQQYQFVLKFGVFRLSGYLSAKSVIDLIRGRATVENCDIAPFTLSETRPGYIDVNARSFNPRKKEVISDD